MRRLLRMFGFVLVGLGVLVALYPILSVWRVSGQVLEELPLAPETTATDSTDRFGLAILDQDFVLATRSYEQLSVEEVERSLAGAGFQRSRIGERTWWVKECCGEWDAVMVDVSEDGAEGTRAEVTVFDTDIQATWFVFPLFGLVLFLPGLLLIGSKPAARNPDVEDPVLV